MYYLIAILAFLSGVCAGGFTVLWLQTRQTTT